MAHDQSSLVVCWESVAGRARFSFERESSVHDGMGHVLENMFKHNDRQGNVSNLFRISTEIRNLLFQIFHFNKSINDAYKVTG